MDIFPITHNFLVGSVNDNKVLFPITHNFFVVDDDDFRDFRITINSGPDASFILPTSGTLNNTYQSYAWIVDWGDGIITEQGWTGAMNSGIPHSYPSINTDYTIKIKPKNLEELGWLRAFGFRNGFIPGTSDSPENKEKVRVVDGQLTERMIRVSVADNEVCANMFAHCPNLTMGPSFNLPQGITDVGNNFCYQMFIGCTSLTMNDIFNLPQGITSVGTYFCSYMFHQCTSLTMNSVFTSPPGITSSVGTDFCSYMFNGCTSLTMNSVFTLPQGITSAGRYFCGSMFSNCTSLTMNSVFNLPQAITSVDYPFCSYMFNGCTSLTMNDVFNLPPGITSAGNYSFCAYMFNGCTSLTMNSVFTLPQGITSAGVYFCEMMFRNCVALTNGVAQFFGNVVLNQAELDGFDNYSYTFHNCSNLTEPLADIPQLQLIPSNRRYTFYGAPSSIIAPLHANWR